MVVVIITSIRKLQAKSLINDTAKQQGNILYPLDWKYEGQAKG